MTHLSIRLLGPFEANLDGEPAIGFHSDKVRALLAYLCVEGKGAHRREQLASLLWPDFPERAARTNLRQTLANLRTVIGDRPRSGKPQAAPASLLITRQTIQFNVDSNTWVDALAFLATLEARQPPLAELEEAVALIRGELMEGFSLPDSAIFEEWLLLQRERFGRLALETLHRLAEVYTAQGDYERALTYAWRQVELDPLRENAHRQLMRLLALSGRRSEALAQYHRCRRLLTEELGVAPSAETTGLFRQIRDGTLAETVLSPQRRLGPTHNLPLATGPFVGREAEVAKIQACLRDPACRLLTLVGAGGMGKTRLALEAVTDWMSGLDVNELEGATLVPLASVQTAEAIAPAIAQAAGFPLSPGREPEQQLLETLRRKRWLLILDSFEHLLEGAGFVAEILRTAPDVTILVTSRARLNLQGESCFPVAGIEFPDQILHSAQEVQTFAAIQLFLQAAHRVQPGLELADTDLAAIARVCHLVRGMPLGILLAAAWSGVLAPAEIAAEIEAEIGRGLDFLEADWADVPQRQRSIRAVFDRSWNLLDEGEREVFQALSVFSGGFTRDAAEHVSGASLRELKVLVDRSLLHRTPAGRYEFHELVRQYAADRLRRAERLNGSPTTREATYDRHSAYYAAALHQWETELKGPRQQAALAQMDPDSENIRAAWEWAIAHDQVEHLASSVGGLALFYWLLGRYEEGGTALRAVTRSLSTGAGALPTLSDDKLRLRIVATVERSNFCRKLGRREQVACLHQQARTLLESPQMEGLDTRYARARLLQSIGHFVLMSDYERGRQLQEQALVLFRELDEQWWMADVLHDLGRAALFTCSVAEARGRFEESLALYQSLGIPLGIAQSTAGLSMVAVCEGHFADAEHYARRAVSCFREYCAPADCTYGLDILGEALEAAGEFESALNAEEECLAIHLDLGQRHYCAYPRAALGRINLHLGRYAEARAHAEIGLDLARETGLRFAEGNAHFVLGSLALIQGVHSDAQEHLRESASVFAQLGDQGSLSRSQALLACAARGSGPSGSVREHLVKSLRQAVASQSFLPFLWALSATGLYLLDEGQVERALELYALASRYPFVDRSRWFADVAGNRLAEIAAARPVERLATLQERGRARDLEATAAELLAELSLPTSARRGPRPSRGHCPPGRPG